MRYVKAAIFAAVAGAASATLPPAPEAAKAAAAEAAAKGAWSDKVAGYQLCQSQNRVADAYRNGAKASGAQIGAPTAVPPCVDPGPYVAAAAAVKPLEASGAHSPAETAKGPPSSNVPASAITGPKKSP